AALVVVSAAYMAETLRAGIQAVPKGQEEAARSLGMSSARTMITITIPQAIRVVIPPLTNEFVLLLKDTSLITAVGAAAGSRELLAVSRDGLVETASGTPLLMAAVMYLVITLPLTQLVAWLERRQGRSR
ncbi:MAG TPA: ABC transporter permease subunit, partial [Marmoricola sp.]|nr:ABC transporter permease subunit [Marmoricola sp.]